MEAYKRVLLTTVCDSVTARRRVPQARKRLERISKRLKLWIPSIFRTQMLVDPHLEIEDASSGSVESTRSTMEDPLLTRHDPITCPSSGIQIQRPRLLATTTIPATSDCRVHKYRDGETPEKDDSKLVPEDHPTTLRYNVSNASEEPEISKDLAIVLSWPGDTPTIWAQRKVTVESFDCIDQDRTKDPNLFVDMLCNLPSSVVEPSKAENSDQDTYDAALRIVITPPEDSWETSCYTAANNRISPQYLGSLIVPPFYQFASRLPKYEEWMALYQPPARTFSNDQPVTLTRTSAAPLVFSSGRFEKRLQQTKIDSYICYYIVTALQRYQLKAVAFSASLKASSFRTRYDIPGFLENIEPRFKWIDPAEILIESFRHTSQSIIIYTSHRPCSVPHIAIHESPPNDPYVVWSNSSDPQNHCFLSISSPNPLLWDNCLTDTSSSVCDSAPVTPKDSPSTTLEQDLDIFFREDIREVRHHENISQEYEDEYVVPQYSQPQPKDTISPSQSKFFIPDDEEEDGLPPLDDWYITIANRCMPSEEAAAVATAAAMSVSCH